MGAYTQKQRLLEITTPLGPDVLLLKSFKGSEAISRLFHFELDLLAENAANVIFDELLGHKVTVRVSLPDEDARFFNGIVSSFSQGGRDGVFTTYRATMVPALWLLTRQVQSRIFQHISVPDILKKVLFVDVAYDLHGTFHPRDYCVQYRESDFDFASRLMEEEGIYYFFQHSASGHKMMVANTPTTHQNLPGNPSIIYEAIAGGTREEERITSWEKVQEIRSGKYTLWDHCFELPHKHLEAEKTIQPTVKTGKVTHKLGLSANNHLEIFDFPGQYAQRFDGMDKGGRETPAELQKIFEDNSRTAGIRMQQEALPSIVINGSSNCRQFVSGYKFELTRHFNADGQYVLTSAFHSGEAEPYTTDGTVDPAWHYANTFTCIPAALPFRPLRGTPKPTVRGCQTAVVVGPAGEEIFTDKYSRVKVQFHWDREGKSDADSSCWVRVGSSWAGKRWGALQIPRIGQEVIVDFEEGDPDQPVIIGSVYNADEMPAYKLPDEKTKSYLKSYSSPGGGGFNEIRLEDKKGQEQVFIHGEKNLDVRIKHNAYQTIENDSHLLVKKDQIEHIQNDHHVKVDRDSVNGFGRDHNLKVTGKQAIEIGQSHSLKVSGDVIEVFSSGHSEQVSMNYYLKALQIVIEASLGITLKCGSNSVVVDPTGVTITGTMVTIDGQMVRIASGPGSPAATGTAGSAVSPASPKEAEEADKADPGEMSKLKAEQIKSGTGKYGAPDVVPFKPPSTADLAQAAKSGPPPKTHFIAIKLHDKDGRGVPGQAYKVTLPDGQVVAEGTLDEKGCARVEGIDPGNCRVTFPGLDKSVWKPK